MYFCKQHGKLDSEWCEECKEILSCDCTDQGYTRFKDLIYDCAEGERTITLRLYHCMTCGEPHHVDI